MQRFLWLLATNLQTNIYYTRCPETSSTISNLVNLDRIENPIKKITFGLFIYYKLFHIFNIWSRFYASTPSIRQLTAKSTERNLTPL